jgi:hypothetical protein
VKLRLGGIVTEHVTVDYSMHLQDSLRIILELTFRPRRERLLQLYRALNEINYRGTTEANVSLLASLARDCDLLPTKVVVKLAEVLVTALWPEPPRLVDLATVITAADRSVIDGFLLRRQPTLAAFGDMRAWRRAFAVALLARSVAGSNIHHSLEADTAAALTEADRLARLVHSPEERSGWADWFGPSSGRGDGQIQENHRTGSDQAESGWASASTGAGSSPAAPR